MLDGEETVEIAWGELRWEGARHHAGRTGNRANSLQKASLGGSDTAWDGAMQHVGWRGNRASRLRRVALAGSETASSSRGNGLGRAQCRAVGAAFSELLARCDCPEKIVDPRLVKRSQDRSNGFQKLKNGTCTAKRLLLQRVSFCMKPLGRG